MASNTYHPSSLPEIDEIELLSLSGITFIGDRTAYADYTNDTRQIVTGNEAREIAQLWRSIPEGDMMRCHVPPFLVKFKVKGIVLLAVTICWGCNNFFGTADNVAVGGTFDRRSPFAKALFDRINKATGSYLSKPR